MTSTAASGPGKRPLAAVQAVRFSHAVPEDPTGNERFAKEGKESTRLRLLQPFQVGSAD